MEKTFSQRITSNTTCITTGMTKVRTNILKLSGFSLEHTVSVLNCQSQVNTVKLSIFGIFVSKITAKFS